MILYCWFSETDSIRHGWCYVCR